jgi:hypothetical protein
VVRIARGTCRPISPRTTATCRAHHTTRRRGVARTFCTANVDCQCTVSRLKGQGLIAKLCRVRGPRVAAANVPWVQHRGRRRRAVAARRRRVHGLGNSRATICNAPPRSNLLEYNV